MAEQEAKVLDLADVRVALCTIFVSVTSQLCILCESQEGKFVRKRECYQNPGSIGPIIVKSGSTDIVNFRNLPSLDVTTGISCLWENPNFFQLQILICWGIF